MLPVHALRNRFDDQVATFEDVEIVFVVCNVDQRGMVLVAERRRTELFQVFDGAQHDAVLRAFLGRQIEQHHGHFGIHAVRGDLRAHYACAEDGNFFDDEIRHGLLPLHS